MQYVGGKFRIRKPLAQFLESVRDGRVFVEPFCGGCNITAEISGSRIASDKCEDVIQMWKAATEGWVPPSVLSENEYNSLKLTAASPLRGFAGFGCSFGGKFFGGYARSGDRNYASNARNSVLKKSQTLQGVHFMCGDYRSLSPRNCLVYCDPPYANTTQGYSSTSFNSREFWETMRLWAKINTVLVSEYTAPQYATEVWRMETKTDMHTKSGKEVRMERLFEVRG